MLLPSHCPVCAAVGPAPCAACRGQLRPAPALPPPPGVDRLVALFSYDGVGRELVARLKYRNARASLPWLVASLVSLLASVSAPAADAVAWVPTTTARRHERGFDQAELVARRLARAVRLPLACLLVHATGPPQTGRSGAERRAGPRIVLRDGARVPGHVLLVDDVVTTGATLSAAARALTAGGARIVSGVAVARTPLKASRGGSDALR